MKILQLFWIFSFLVSQFCCYHHDRVSDNTHGSLMDLSWIIHGSLMDHQWIPHGSFLDPTRILPWIIHGSYTDHTWIIQGSYMDLTGSSMDHPRIIHGSSTDHPPIIPNMDHTLGSLILQRFRRKHPVRF